MFRFRSSAIALLAVNLAAVARADWEQALIWRLRNRSGHDLNLWAESHDGRVGASREPEGDQPAVVAELVRRSRHGAGLPAHGFTVEPGETVQLHVDCLDPERPLEGGFDVADAAGRPILELLVETKGGPVLELRDLRPGGRTEQDGATLVVREAVQAETKAGPAAETKETAGAGPARPGIRLEPLPPSVRVTRDTLGAWFSNRSGETWTLRCYQQGVRVVPLHPRPGDPRIRDDPRRYQIEPGEVIQLQQSRAALSGPVNLEGSYVLADDGRRAGAALVWDNSREPPVLVVDEYKDPSRHLLAEPGAPITLGPADWLRCEAGRVLILKPLSREQFARALGEETKRTADNSGAAAAGTPAGTGATGPALG